MIRHSSMSTGTLWLALLASLSNAAHLTPSFIIGGPTTFTSPRSNRHTTHATRQQQHHGRHHHIDQRERPTTTTKLHETTSEELSNAEISRYSRHLVLGDVGVAGQKALKNSSVLVIGAGGLGSPCLLYLAAAGVGYIGIVDADIVDESNLQRQ
eukprot:CAMPEP_0201679528 /NCGR_PEP_ID=MMETSP0494-20130426/48652_1 /ASSEMBLY_ACC=CAM_ASM_000839 /TAXON_ID=420259 /ORGANISM="Thalassiosira gravida, Strain GMp14c1" /LENGTH=153 /DNA_ID=CAMNT_0048163029 /DNA_START=24 /DNA_END=482 /DNA_ORIENTATION=+